MLQKIKYEAFNYGKYEKLKKLFTSNDFDPEKQTELDISNQRATELPTTKCLELLGNL